MDQAAFRAFYQQMAPRLRAYVAQSCGSIDAADDILQEAFIKFLCCTDKTDERNMRAYLYRTADSLIIDYWRRGKREAKRDEAFLAQAAAPVNRYGNDDLKTAFNELKLQQRSLLWLAYVEGCDHKEIAAAAGVKEKSVRVLLFRARRALANLLQASGIGPEAA